MGFFNNTYFRGTAEKKLVIGGEANYAVPGESSNFSNLGWGGALDGRLWILTKKKGA